jgi:hypothetical protein
MSRIHAGGLAVAIFATVAMPAAAQAGFFDQLFGGGQAQPFGYQTSPFGDWGAPPIRRRAHHVRAVVEEKLVRQTPTDLMHDQTLRYGDAVMMKSGIAIFTGERSSSHDREDFSPLQDARVRPREKLALGALDGSKSSDQLVSGRSSSTVTPVLIVKGVMIHDPSGKSIRYVGP